MAGTARPGRLTWQLAELVTAVAEAPRVTTILFDVPGWPGHRAGQHVDVRLTAEDGYHAERSYPIASAPAGTRVAPAVHRLADGEVSPYLTGELRPGDTIELPGPAGGSFARDPSGGGPLMLVAGGSGIVPLMAMIRTRAAPGDDTQTRLLCSSPSQDDIIYRDELDRLSGNGLTVAHAPTDAQPPGGRATRAASTPRCPPRSRPPRPSGRLCTRADRRRSPRRRPDHPSGSDTTRGRSRPDASDPPDADMAELTPDPNAIAGLLQEVSAAEMTTAIGTCGSCGAAAPAGAARLYRGAGIVLRSPHRTNVLAKIVKNDSQAWIDSHGIRTLHVAVQPERRTPGPHTRSSEPA